MATPLPIVATANPHYARLGGREQVVRLVDAFYDAMDTLPQAQAIRAMHASDLAPTRAVLVDYLSEWLGGPRDYSAARGKPRLRHVHRPFPIDERARDAWMACMRQALDQVCTDDALRAELEHAFLKIADFLRNTPTPAPTRSP